jgi:hypothetical protein
VYTCWVVMVKSKKNEREHCWEFMNCSLDIMKQCFAYKSNTVEQYWILNNLSKGDGCKILDSCKHCPWFLKNNPQFTHQLG